MIKLENDPTLSKAHSVVAHLGKMKKAVNSFNSHMMKLHTAHHQDMHAALGKLSKMVGIEPAEEKEYGGGNNEPVSTDLEGSGTHNLQDFGGGTKSPDAAKAAKAAAGETMTKAEVAEIVSNSMSEFMGEFMKAFTASDDSTLANVHAFPSPQTGQIQKANGVGDRTQVRQPVQQAVTKSEGGGPVITEPVSVTLTPELAKRAMEGDRQAIIDLMKSARPAEIPDTLVAPLAKIH